MNEKRWKQASDALGLDINELKNIVKRKNCTKRKRESRNKLPTPFSKPVMEEDSIPNEDFILPSAEIEKDPITKVRLEPSTSTVLGADIPKAEACLEPLESTTLGGDIPTTETCPEPLVSTTLGQDIPTMEVCLEPFASAVPNASNDLLENGETVVEGFEALKTFVATQHPLLAGCKFIVLEDSKNPINPPKKILKPVDLENFSFVEQNSVYINREGEVMQAIFFFG